MNALSNKQRPMKWGYAGDQAPLMGRRLLARAFMPGGLDPERLI
jgi:hypothetical protein